MTKDRSSGWPPALAVLAAALALILPLLSAALPAPARAQETAAPPSDEVRIITLPEPGGQPQPPTGPAAKPAKKPAPQGGGDKAAVKTFGAWTLRCIAVEEEQAKQRICQVNQSVFLNDERRTQILDATLFYPAGGDKLAMLLYLPLGVLLPPGAVVQIDQGEERSYPYSRCDQAGCRVEILVDEALLTGLKAGQQASISILDAPRRKLAIPLSLQGLTAALAALKS